MCLHDCTSLHFLLTSLQISCDHCWNVTCATTDLCNPQRCDANSGICYAVPLDCEDQNPCTNDTCFNGTCEHTPLYCPYTNSCLPSSCSNGDCVISAVSCDDFNPCTMDSCNGTGPSPICLHFLNTCNNSDLCNPQSCNSTTGACQIFPINCDDNNPCTVDACNQDSCIHTPMNCSSFDPCNPSSCKNGKVPNY